jgi:hypothetical protein
MKPQSYKKKFKDAGFFIVEDFFTEEEIEKYREAVENFFKIRNINKLKGGRCVGGWTGKFKELEELSNLTNGRFSEILSSPVFNNQPWRYLNHSDLHQDKITDWHRDIGDLKRGIKKKYKKLSLKSDECLIVKICFFLQDHHDNKHGLWMKPNSQFTKKANKEYISSKKTDIIVFDQRLLHKGQLKQYYKATGKHRYLVTLAFGLDNDYGKAHELGATIRQANQQKETNI